MKSLATIPEQVGGLPNICGSEDLVKAAMDVKGPFYLPESRMDFGAINSAFSVALHMHQPLIPAGGSDLKTAAVIGNLQYMMEHQGSGDNHNASVFLWCYRRMSDFIRELAARGLQPRVMLEYSGCLLHGLRTMGQGDVLDALRGITCDPKYRHCVEWLGAPWGHAVAPSTPVQDYAMHVRAWQHHFAAIFGFEALSRVRGFSPSEMALPNHPDVCYAFVRTLKECGYQWLLVQEHTVEQVDDGGRIRATHLPHRLVAKNSRGDVQSITAIIKTQGSDTKLIGQMQPYYEARGLSRVKLDGRLIPQLVTQIADGENGGVMMNEFPDKYRLVMAEASGTSTPPVNVTEYLEHLDRMGHHEKDFVPVQPIMQQRVWARFPEDGGPEVMTRVINELKKEDGRFNMDGGSWTNDRSWVRGYDHVLGPMENASALFAEKVLAHKVHTSEARYRNALYHLLMTQTSCYRFWGSGLWTDYARELCRRTDAILRHDF